MSSKKIVKNIFENTDKDKVAISSENNSKISFRDLKTFIEDISKQLSGAGLTNKDRAAIVLPNGPAMATSFLGISSYMRWIGDKPGAEWVELPVHNSPNGKEFIINGVECKIKYRMNIQKSRISML